MTNNNDDWLHKQPERTWYTAAIVVDRQPVTNQLGASQALERLGFPDWDVDIDASGGLLVAPDSESLVEVASVLADVGYYETFSQDGSVVLTIEIP